MQLPVKLPLDLMQTKWSAILNPLIANSINNVLILPNIVLASGETAVNHLLGRVQQGWFLTDIQGIAAIYRSGAFNDRALILTSNASVTVSIGVF